MGHITHLENASVTMFELAYQKENGEQCAMMQD